MFKLTIEVAELGVDIHNWTASEKTQVFPVKTVLHLAFVQAVVGALLLAIGITLA